jgi:hypothetical protein
MHRHGINQGLTLQAKQLLRPALRSKPVSAIINSHGKEVDSLNLVTRSDGSSFVEVVDRTVEHRGGTTVYFLSLVDRAGMPVAGSTWSDEEVLDALRNLEKTGTVEFANRLARGSAPPTSYLVH